MKVALIGQKGIPATFGGIEYHVDQLSRGLVRNGLPTSVYVRSWYTPRQCRSYQGVRLVHVPTVRTKHLDAAVHSLLSTVHCLFTGARLVHYHGLGPAVFCWLPRLAGRRVVVTVHRLDWAAAKWGTVARTALKLAEWAAVRFPHRTIVVSRDIRDHLLKKYGVETTVIPNGGERARFLPLSSMAGRYGLEAGKYVLFLGRLVPEKRPDWLVRAFRETARPTDGLKLVLAGGSSGTDGYVRSLKALAGDDPRIVFTGVVQGDDKRELLGNARLFVLPSRLEGHPIALLEAWAYGLGCLTSDIEPFRVAVRDGVDGIMFRNDDYDDFRAKLSGCLRASERLWEMGRLARERAAAHPDWPTVIEATRALYGSVGGRSPR